MTEPSAARKAVYADEEISVLALASMMLRWRRTIIALAVAGGVLGVAKGLTTTRVYKSGATFIPQGSESGASGLSVAAGQLGVRLANMSWGPAMYVQVLRSRALLEPLALDTLVVAEQGGRRVAVMDLFQIKAATPPLRVDRAIASLLGFVRAEEVRSLGAVRLSVTTPWASVSLALAEKLVRGVNEFDFKTRKSQATAERQFVETQGAEAERALRSAEDRMLAFLERNRTIGSPDLMLERDRLQREITLRQQLYTSLLQSSAEARMREVRDTPVITVLEEPRLPTLGEPRNSLTKGVLGALGGAMIGVLLAFLAHGIARARSGSNENAQEFFQLIEEAKPRFLQRRGQRKNQ